MNWWQLTKRIIKTIDIGIISWWFVVFMMVMSIPAAILLIVDVIHYIWTDQRIPEIVKILDGYVAVFKYPFDHQ